MIIKTKRRFIQHFFDIVLTAFAWFIFILFFGGGILALLRDEIRGSNPIFIPSQLSQSFSSLTGYILLMLGFATFLILWAKYNQYRFAGVDRRKSAAPLEAAQLQSSFGVSQQQLTNMQTSRFIVMKHEEDGRISDIHCLDEELKTL